MKKHTPVTLRRRKLPSGLTSLYLDIYDRGERSYEYLRLYLQPETNREAKAANRETLRLAEDIAARRLADILEERRTGKKVARMTFAELYDEMMDERKGSNVVHNVSLRRWAAAAGIEKPLTFHLHRLEHITVAGKQPNE